MSLGNINEGFENGFVIKPFEKEKKEISKLVDEICLSEIDSSIDERNHLQEQVEQKILAAATQDVIVKRKLGKQGQN